MPNIATSIVHSAQELAHLERLGSEAFVRGRYAEALTYLLRIKDLTGVSDGWKSNALQCYVILGDIPSALPLAEELAHKWPERHEYAFFYSLCLSALGRFKEGYDVIAHLPNSIRGMASQKARYLLRTGDVRLAMQLVCEDEKFLPLEKTYSRLNLNPKKRYKEGLPLAGKTVLILPQGGYGDSVATTRFSALFHVRGARVILGERPLLHPLFSRLPWPVECRLLHDIKESDYDWYISNASADLMLRLDEFDPLRVSPIPYITSTPEKREEWREIIDRHAAGRPKIAVHWQGQHEIPNVGQPRDVPYEIIRQFSKLGALYSFQRGDAALHVRPEDDMCVLGPRFVSLEDTAGALDQMDYVVTGDAFLAHLAGAMGKKTAVLLHLDHFLLWIRGADQALWHPSVRMFKQKAFGEWDDVGRQAFEWILRDQLKISV